jgi:hypothetical protein
MNRYILLTGKLQRVTSTGVSLHTEMEAVRTQAYTHVQYVSDLYVYITYLLTYSPLKRSS